MSIGLDVALYFRNSEEAKQISLSERCVLFTLAYRVGNKNYSWISQKTLSEELCIKERCMIKYLTRLKELNLIQTFINKRDKRRNLYKIDERLINKYKDDEVDQKKYMHERAGISEKNTCTKMHLNNVDTCTNVHLSTNNTCTNVQVSCNENVMQVYDLNDEFLQKKSPKYTYKKQINIKTKEAKTSRKKREDVLVDFPSFFNKELWGEFIQHRKLIKSPMSILAQKKAINQLTKFREGGQDVDQIINNSIINGWKGLFEVKFNKDKQNGTSSKYIKPTSSASKFFEAPDWRPGPNTDPNDSWMPRNWTRQQISDQARADGVSYDAHVKKLKESLFRDGLLPQQQNTNKLRL